MTFDELFKEHQLTTEERTALVAYLASLRMLATPAAFTFPYLQQWPAGASQLFWPKGAGKELIVNCLLDTIKHTF